MKITHTAKVEVSHAGELTAADLRPFVEALPDDARITAIMRDHGTQRDPDERLQALVANWETEE